RRAAIRPAAPAPITATSHVEPDMPRPFSRSAHVLPDDMSSRGGKKRGIVLARPATIVGTQPPTPQRDPIVADATLGPLLRHLRPLAALRGDEGRTDGELLRAFLAGGDQAAFAALVRRHSPLVLGVCRRVVRQEQDAEDACQATFLLLARRAGSIRKQESLARWLHGVAYRMGADAPRAASPRRQHDGPAPP